MADRRLAVRLNQSAPIPLDVEFACAAGEVLAIFGPSGGGKTTILRSIAGLYRPAEALVRAGDRTWTDTASATCVPPHERAVGFVFQEYALFPHLSAIGNVMTALGHRPKRDRRARARELLAMVHLSQRETSRPGQLSGGERQRVALARALAREPAVLLLDEPFAAVDRAVRRRLQDEIDEIRRSLDIPLILVTHDFDDVVRLATHLLIVDRGSTVAEGRLADLTSRPDVPWLRDAIGLGSVFDARVERRYPDRGLVALALGDATVLVADRGFDVGTEVRIRIPAREVILAANAPAGLSLHNALAGIVSAVDIDAAANQAVVQIAVGTTRLLAEVTRDAVDRLSIAVGRPVHALIKSVAIEVAGSRVSSD